MSDPFERLRKAAAATRGSSSDFDLNPGTVLPPDRLLREAGVLVPVRATAGGLRLVLTKRSSALRHHPGQIAFPGGKVDPGDADAQAAAMREAHEEIGLTPGDAVLLGQLPPHETVTGFMVTPVLAAIPPDFRGRPEIGEVEEIFEVPFDHVTDPARFAVRGRRWRGQIRYYYAVPYGPYYIWGATARILRALADRMGT